MLPSQRQFLGQRVQHQIGSIVAFHDQGICAVIKPGHAGRPPDHQRPILDGFDQRQVQRYLDPTRPGQHPPALMPFAAAGQLDRPRQGQMLHLDRAKQIHDKSIQMRAKFQQQIARLAQQPQPEWTGSQRDQRQAPVDLQRRHPAQCPIADKGFQPLVSGQGQKIMTDPQHFTRLIRRLPHAHQRLRRQGHWFFDKAMQPRVQAVQGNGFMRWWRGQDMDRIAQARCDHVINAAKRGHGIGCGKGLRRCQGRITDRRQFQPRQSADRRRMPPRDIARTDNADTQVRGNFTIQHQSPLTCIR